MRRQGLNTQHGLCCRLEGRMPLQLPQPQPQPYLRASVHDRLAAVLLGAVHTVILASAECHKCSQQALWQLKSRPMPEASPYRKF